MIVLDTTTKKLEIGLAGAVATTEPHVTVCFYDVPAQTKNDNSEYAGGTTLSKTTGATAKTICAAPSIAGTTRKIMYICVFNADSASVTPTVRIDDGGTDYTQYSQALAAGKSLVYEDGQGWQVI
jgi:hypothetical protein